MKKITYIFLSILATTFVSCEDFLNVDSPSSFDTDYVFSSVADADKMLLGSYACFPVDPYTSRMSNVFMQNTDVESSAPGANPDGSRRDVWTLQGGLLQNWSDIERCWDNCYLAIDRANQCIEGIEASSLYKSGDAEMKQLLGEAYCLRAYWYWMLCNYWGDVPLALQASKAGMELNTPRVDKNIVYSAMIQSLVDHEEGMLFADQAKHGIERMNREFALGFIAKLAMFRAGYGTTQEGSQKKADDYMEELPEVTYSTNGTEHTAKTSADYYQLAKTYAQKLIQLKDRELNPNFKEIFYNQCQFVSPKNDDILFEVAFVQNGGGDVGWCIGLTVDGGAYGSGGSYIFFPVTYYYSFDDNDLRLPVTCSLVKYENESKQAILGPNSTVPAKWCRLWLKESPGSTSSKGTGINWPILRYSDVLLLLAEAENELNGPTDLAKNMLKRVRNRAFAPEDRATKVDTYVNTFGSKEAFFEAIVNERAWEFGGECIRKFDLIRWGNYGKKIVETKTTLSNMGKAANEQELTDPNVSKYKDLSSVFYYQLNKGVIDILNPRYNPSVVPDKVVSSSDLKDGDGNYASQNWTKNLWKKVTTKVGDEDVITWEEADYTARSWRGYTDPTGTQPVPYLLPIPYQRIVDSEGVLNNNGYGLVLY